MAKNKIDLTDYSTKTVEIAGLYKKLKDVQIISVDSSICEVIGDKREIKPLLEIRKSHEENNVEITTFGYVGRFSYLGHEFNITYRFGDVLLDRMIRKVNDFEIESIEYESQNKKNTTDNLALKILYLNFILKLEKLSVFGMPKHYQKVEYTDKFRGQVDINRFIKKDLPFQGKISSNSYEHVYVQEILDVIYNALLIVEHTMKKMVQERLWSLRNLLHHHGNRTFINESLLEKALQHKTIQNPLYYEFKQILEIASYILRHNNNQEHKAKSIALGLIFDVSLLWENYLYVLLKLNIENADWNVIHEEPLKVYKDQFYTRYMYPDIVIKNEKDKTVIVLDAKSKSMLMRGTKENIWDVDRNDFFQINTYMSYYHNQGLHVKVGGLLYPMESFEKSQCYSENWFGNSDTKFIVDGIDLSEDGIIKAEESFIKRLNELMNNKEKNVLQPIQ